jgi:hydroxymethylbilane synthase
VLEVEEFLPAIGQGAIAVVARGNDVRTQDRLAAISDVDTVAALAAERAFLMVLEGSCRTPIAGHAAVKGKTLQFHGLVLRPDGSEAFEVRRNGTFAEAAALGADAGQEIKGRIPADFFGT